MQINRRYLAKTISWRIIGTLDTLFFAWLFSGNLTLSLGISGITVLSKMIWYYFHEKVWSKALMANPNRVHIIKTFTWRFIGTIDTIIFSWIFLGDLTVGLQIGFAETLTKMILYYLHEKVWFKIKYGIIE